MRQIDLDKEREYENSKILSDDVRKDQGKYYWATEIPTKEHIEQTYLAIKGLSGLEIGCSRGSDAVGYAKYCSKFIGIDISDEAIKLAKSKNIANCEFICTDGHNLPFEEESFDFVIVNSLLHHLDLDSTFVEINRVLKPKGKLIFREPLGTNPLFQIYRFLTPTARTDDERPFTFADIRLMKTHFEFSEIRWFGFLVIGAAFFKSAKLRIFLTQIDDILSKTPLKYVFWQFSGVLHKR